MTSRGGATITWTAGNMPAEINGNGYTAAFEYAPDGARWRQTSTYPDGTETTVYIGGLMEKLIRPANTTYKHLIPTPSGFVQYIRRPGGFTATYYLASDHLGSTDAVLNSPGTVMVRPSFAAFGARRDDDWNGLPSAAEIDQIEATSRRGFTGHEMLDNVGLVHMNGRVYDPAIGRFISADPFIDGETNPQGWNRYAYVQNRSCSSTDSTGFSNNDRPHVKPKDGSPIPPQDTVVVTGERIRPEPPGYSPMIGGGGGTIRSIGGLGDSSGRTGASQALPKKRSDKDCVGTCRTIAAVSLAAASGVAGGASFAQAGPAFGVAGFLIGATIGGAVGYLGHNYGATGTLANAAAVGAVSNGPRFGTGAVSGAASMGFTNAAEQFGIPAPVSQVVGAATGSATTAYAATQLSGGLGRPTSTFGGQHALATAAARTAGTSGLVSATVQIAVSDGLQAHTGCNCGG